MFQNVAKELLLYTGVPKITHIPGENLVNASRTSRCPITDCNPFFSAFRIMRYLGSPVIGNRYCSSTF